MNNSASKPPSSNHFKMPHKVAIVYSDVKREYFPTEAQYLTEKDAKEDAEVVAKHIRRLNIEAVIVPADAALTEELKKAHPDMVFNLVGSVKGNEYLASCIPGILELLGIPYTGAGILGEALDYNKFLIKKLMQQAEIPVPNCQLFISHTDFIDPSLRFPLISKLNEIHGAVEITQNAVSLNEKHLRDRLKFLISTYKQPVIVEEFIVGREIVALLLEGVNKKVYLAEKIFKGRGANEFVFQTFDDQWTGKTDTIVYDKYDNKILRELVRKAFAVTKMSDYGKFDIRMDNSGRFYFIDANSNPAFGPKELDCAISNVLSMYGISFADILKRIIDNTMDGNGNEA